MGCAGVRWEVKDKVQSDHGHLISNIMASELDQKCEDKPLKGFWYQNHMTGCVCIAGKDEIEVTTLILVRDNSRLIRIATGINIQKVNSWDLLSL